MKHKTIVSMVFLITGICIFASSVYPREGLVPLNIADKAAICFSERVWPTSTIESTQIYYGVDDKPAVYVFTVRREKKDTQLQELLPRGKGPRDKLIQEDNVFEDKEFSTMVVSARYEWTPVIEFYDAMPLHYRKAKEVKNVAQKELNSNAVNISRYIFYSPLDIWVECECASDTILISLFTLKPFSKQEIFSLSPVMLPEELMQRIEQEWSEIEQGKGGSKSSEQYRISGVPYYDWSYGCSPTASAMVLGYWDANGYPNLVDYYFRRWDAVEGEWDDNVPNVQQQLAIAMETDTMTGLTWAYKIPPGNETVCNDPEWENNYNFYSSYWSDNQEVLINEIFKDHPVHWVLIGHPTYETHSVTAVGWGPPDTNYIRIHDTWVEIDRVISFEWESSSCLVIPLAPMFPACTYINDVDINPIYTNVIYAGDDWGVCKSIDYGDNWLLYGLDRKIVQCVAIDPAEPNTIYAGVKRGWGFKGVYKTNDGGITWTQISNGITDLTIPYAITIDPNNSDVIYIAGAYQFFEWPWICYEGKIYKSTNGGNSWTLEMSGFPQYSVICALAIDPTNSDIIYAGYGWGGFDVVDCGVCKSTDGGNNWSKVNNGLVDYSQNIFPYIFALAIDPDNPSTVYAGVSFDGYGDLTTKIYGVYKTTNGGGNWIPVNTGINANTFIGSLIIDPTTPSKIYAGSAGCYGGSGINTVYKTTNGGSFWSNTSWPVGASVFSLDVNPGYPDIVYVATYGNGIYRYDPSTSPPTLPIGLTLTAGIYTIDVSWGQNSITTGYKIYYGTSSGNYTSCKDVGNRTHFILSESDGIEENTTYYLVVTAYNRIGESSYSEEKECRTKLAPPTNLTADAVSYQQINLSWQDNSICETEYLIERKDGDGGTWHGKKRTVPHLVTSGGVI